MPKTDFSATQVAAITGVTYQTLDRWLKDGVVTCDVPAEGTGSRRRFTYHDVVLVMLARRLKEHSFPLPMIRDLVATIRDNWYDDNPEGAGYLLFQLRDRQSQGIWLLDSVELARRFGVFLQDKGLQGDYQGIYICIDVVYLARYVKTYISAVQKPAG